ncbi:GDP dissociation inhibitor-domain-containing protein [Chlamydoabsidia padenii]|nr:GDP dissociation inhibitor-domain-containing protein [Chlamydoabsidia padenii]
MKPRMKTTVRCVASRPEQLLWCRISFIENKSDLNLEERIKLAQVPTRKRETLSSSLMEIDEINHIKKFLERAQEYKNTDFSTHQGLNISSLSMKQVFDSFGLAPGTQQLIGHAIALRLDDSYLDKPARDTVEKTRLYADHKFCIKDYYLAIVSTVAEIDKPTEMEIQKGLKLLGPILDKFVDGTQDQVFIFSIL